MRKGLFDRLEDIINQTKQENKNNPQEEDAPASIFDMILEKSKEILSDDDDENTAKRKIEKKVDEVAAEHKGKAPTSIFDRVKDLVLENVEEELQEDGSTSKQTNRGRANKSKTSSNVIPHINIPYYKDLTDEHKEKFVRFREDKVDDIDKLIEKNKREEERLVTRNDRELERQIQWKNREEEELIERMLRKQERDIKRNHRKT